MRKKIDPELKWKFMENLEKRKAAFAQNLLVARKATEKKQEDLIGQNVSTRITISRIETGDGDPRLSSIVSLATTLGVSPILLLIDSDELIEIARELENWNKNKTEIPEASEAVELNRPKPSTRSRRDKALAVAQRLLQPIGEAEKIGVAIGTAHQPGEGSHIGQAIGRALSTK